MLSIIPDSAKVPTLQQMINRWLSVDFWCHLGKPGLAADINVSLAACLAVECTFIGYGAQRLSTWTLAQLVPGLQGMSQSTASFAVADPAGSGDISGYFLTNSANTELYGVVEFTLPFYLNVPSGETLNVPVLYQLMSFYPYPPPPIP
jgi:hypothetical protein